MDPFRNPDIAASIGHTADSELPDPSTFTTGDGTTSTPTGEQPSGDAATSTPSTDERLAAVEHLLDQALAQRATTPVPATVNPRELAAALTEAQVEQRRQWAREQEAAAAMQPPKWTEDEKAKIVADPDLLYNKVLELAGFAHKAAVAQLLPRVRAGEIVHQLSQKQVDLMADYALTKARDLLRAQGVDPGELDREDLLSGTYQTLQDAAQQSQGDPNIAYTNMTLDPRAIATAALMTRNRLGGGPAITNRRSPAPSVGTGVSTHTERTPPARRPDAVVRMETNIGKKFTDAELRAAAEKAKQYDAVL